jgi:hypothetical protein
LPSSPLHAALRLIEYGEEILWRVRHAPDERRRLARMALSPACYPARARRLLDVARGGLPAAFPGRVKVGRG